MRNLLTRSEHWPLPDTQPLCTQLNQHVKLHIGQNANESFQEIVDTFLTFEDAHGLQLTTFYTFELEEVIQLIESSTLSLGYELCKLCVIGSVFLRVWPFAKQAWQVSKPECWCQSRRCNLNSYLASLEMYAQDTFEPDSIIYASQLLGTAASMVQAVHPTHTKAAFTGYEAMRIFVTWVWDYEWSDRTANHDTYSAFRALHTLICAHQRDLYYGQDFAIDIVMDTLVMVNLRLTRASWTNLHGRKPALFTLTQHETIKKHLADTIPANASDNTMINIGLAAADESAAYDAPQDVYIIVHGFDECKRSELDANFESHKENDDYCTSDFLSEDWKKNCDIASKSMRRKIGKDAAEVVEMCTREHLPESYNFEYCTLTTCSDGKTCINVGQNVGNKALVFHSPKRGLTLFLSDKINPNSVSTWSKLIITPSEDGKTEQYNTKEPDQLRKLIKSVQNSPDQDAKHMHTKLAFGDNQYVSVLQEESLYKKSMPLQVAPALAAECSTVKGVRTVCCVFNRVAPIDCQDIPSVIDLLQPNATHCNFENVAYWRDALCQFDPAHRPATLMNSQTEQLDHTNKVAYWKIQVSALKSLDPAEGESAN